MRSFLILIYILIFNTVAVDCARSSPDANKPKPPNKINSSQNSTVESIQKRAVKVSPTIPKFKFVPSRPTSHSLGILEIRRAKDSPIQNYGAGYGAGYFKHGRKENCYPVGDFDPPRRHWEVLKKGD